MPTEAEIAAYSATNNYPLCGVRAFAQAQSRLPADDAELCQWASANALLDPVAGVWLCSDPAGGGLLAWIQAHPWQTAGIGVAAWALTSRSKQRRR